VTDSNVIDIADLDQRVFEERLTGRSIRSISREFGLSTAKVEHIIANHCTPITVEAKLRALQLDLHRLDELMRTYLPKAMNGDLPAANLCIRICEQRAMLMGLNAPVRVDPIQLSVEAAPKPTSTDLIEAAIMRIAHDPLYGGDRKRSDNGGDPPDSDPPAA
jgi:hypothetical protein